MSTGTDVVGSSSAVGNDHRDCGLVRLLPHSVAYHSTSAKFKKSALGSAELTGVVQVHVRRLVLSSLENTNAPQLTSLPGDIQAQNARLARYLVEENHRPSLGEAEIVEENNKVITLLSPESSEQPGGCPQQQDSNNEFEGGLVWCRHTLPELGFQVGPTNVLSTPNQPHTKRQPSVIPLFTHVNTALTTTADHCSRGTLLLCQLVGSEKEPTRDGCCYSPDCIIPKFVVEYQKVSPPALLGCHPSQKGRKVLLLNGISLVFAFLFGFALSFGLGMAQLVKENWANKHLTNTAFCEFSDCKCYSGKHCSSTGTLRSVDGTMLRDAVKTGGCQETADSLECWYSSDPTVLKVWVQKPDPAAAKTQLAKLIAYGVVVWPVAIQLLFLLKYFSDWALGCGNLGNGRWPCSPEYNHD
eukprot:TRINITY_DN68123_c2_g6_i2.p1 TRINITY_DN68123_c2_g6~~TRINITY_DN68123_c2_g6_i2.p1  ORF type:complete len:413 (+),score=40.47 TRINITY_DN68123_c2_g6_i2:84-1322(+)